MTNPLLAVPQKHEDELIEFLKFNKYPYGVGFLAVAVSVSGRFGAVEVDYMLEQQRTDLFCKKNLRSLSSMVATVSPMLECLRTLVSRKPNEPHSPVG